MFTSLLKCPERWLGLCRHKRQASVSSGSSSDASMQTLLSSLENIRPGSLFYGKYLVEQGIQRGTHTAMIFGHAQNDPSQEVSQTLLNDLREKKNKGKCWK